MGMEYTGGPGFGIIHMSEQEEKALKDRLKNSNIKEVPKTSQIPQYIEEVPEKSHPFKHWFKCYCYSTLRLIKTIATSSLFFWVMILIVMAIILPD